MAANDDLITEGPTPESLANETLPVLPEGTAEEIEHFVEYSGTERRIALAFLSAPFPVQTERLRDRELAATMASMALLLDYPCEKYAHLAQLLSAARARIIMAILAAQGDGWDILEKAGVSRETVRAVFGAKDE